jgi:hypothetical protein
MQLTPQDIQNALIFLNRVELKGNESMAHAEMQKPPAPAPETPIDEPEPDTKGKK